MSVIARFGTMVGAAGCVAVVLFVALQRGPQGITTPGLGHIPESDAHPRSRPQALLSEGGQPSRQRTNGAVSGVAPQSVSLIDALVGWPIEGIIQCSACSRSTAVPASASVPLIHFEPCERTASLNASSPFSRARTSVRVDSPLTVVELEGQWWGRLEIVVPARLSAIRPSAIDVLFNDTRCDPPRECKRALSVLLNRWSSTQNKSTETVMYSLDLPLSDSVHISVSDDMGGAGVLNPGSYLRVYLGALQSGRVQFIDAHSLLPIPGVSVTLADNAGISTAGRLSDVHGQIEVEYNGSDPVYIYLKEGGLWHYPLQMDNSLIRRIGPRVAQVREPSEGLLSILIEASGWAISLSSNDGIPLVDTEFTFWLEWLGPRLNTMDGGKKWLPLHRVATQTNSAGLARFDYGGRPGPGNNVRIGVSASGWAPLYLPFDTRALKSLLDHENGGLSVSTTEEGIEYYVVVSAGGQKLAGYEVSSSDERGGYPTQICETNSDGRAGPFSIQDNGVVISTGAVAPVRQAVRVEDLIRRNGTQEVDFFLPKQSASAVVIENVPRGAPTIFAMDSFENLFEFTSTAGDGSLLEIYLPSGEYIFGPRTWVMSRANRRLRSGGFGGLSVRERTVLGWDLRWAIGSAVSGIVQTDSNHERSLWLSPIYDNVNLYFYPQEATARIPIDQNGRYVISVGDCMPERLVLCSAVSGLDLDGIVALGSFKPGRDFSVRLRDISSVTGLSNQGHAELFIEFARVPSSPPMEPRHVKRRVGHWHIANGLPIGPIPIDYCRVTYGSRGHGTELYPHPATESVVLVFGDD